MDLRSEDPHVEHGLSISGIQADSSGILSEAKTRELSKSFPSLRLKSDDVVSDDFIRNVQSLIIALCTTLASSQTSLGHGAAICDALCGLLELCEASTNTKIKLLAFDCATWTQIFDIYLTSFENHKSKPMGHLLSTLTRIVSKYPDEPGRGFLIRHAVSGAVLTLDGDSESSSIKAAAQALERFISKNVISSCQLMSMLDERKELGFISVAAAKSQWIKPLRTPERVKLMDDFVFCVLQWVQYPDVAPSIGRFISTFFLSLQKDITERESEERMSPELPLWFHPIQRTLEEQPELLHGLEKHILPSLLRLSSADTQDFLAILPLEDLQDGIIGVHTIGDIQLCLLTVRIVVELSSSHGSQSDLPGIVKLHVLELQNLGAKLLTHSSPEIRIAAFDLAMYSRSSIEPLSKKILDTLRQTLPNFHAEVSPKSRNEFLSQMKRLFTRLRDSTSSLKKERSTRKPIGNKSSLDESSIQDFGDDLVTNTNIMGQQILFLGWYADFLVSELRPTSSYQRHITALKMLHFLLQLYGDEGIMRLPGTSTNEISTEALQKKIPVPRLLRCIMDLMLDPFDDVRQGAAAVLELMPPPPLLAATFNNSESSVATGLKINDKTTPDSTDNRLVDTLYRAEALMRDTGRADHADGVGRTYSLLYKTCPNVANSDVWYKSRSSVLEHILEHLQYDIMVAQTNLRKAVGEHPLHGYLIALRHIVSRPDFYESFTQYSDTGYNMWKHLRERLLASCRSVWEAVKEVLCIDSPEGQASEEDEIDGLDIGTKDTLSFSWRALKESSSLLHAMIVNPGYGPPNYLRYGLWHDELWSIGSLAFTQLAELRHRGAFSTVSSVYAACCIRCIQTRDLRMRLFLDSWYEDALASIQQNASKLTRRSAGIPSMITGILAAHPVGDYHVKVIFDLQTIADEPVPATNGEKEMRLPQVHALNCLRDVFTDTRLGPATERHVSDTLEIAASCIESKIWEIRNCGLMLFKALIRRLNGGTDTSSTRASSSHRRFSKSMYENYSRLPDLLLKMLRQVDAPRADDEDSESSASMQAQRVFPALEIIEIAGLPPQNRVEIKKLIWYHLEGSAWPIREKAAKTLGLVLGDKDHHTDIETLLRPDWQSHNALHGRLLYLRNILAGNKGRTSDRSQNNLGSLLTLLESSFETVVIPNKCPFIIAAYLNIIADVLAALINFNSGLSRSFALKCGDMFSRRWPSPPTPGSSGEVSERLSSSLLSIASDRCWSLISKASCSTAQATPQPINLTSGRVTAEEDELTGVPVASSTALSDISQRKGPLDFEEALRLEGSHVAQNCISSFNDSNIQSQLPAWIRALGLAGHDRSELSTRMAAVTSIKCFFAILQAHGSISKTAPQLLDVYLALYDALVDDDEEVRDQAAEVSSSLLSIPSSYGEPGKTPSLSLSPLAASPRLLQFLAQEYNTSVNLWLEAVRRVTGACSPTTGLPTRDTPALQLRPVQALLEDAMPTDKALFVEEKQNLFIDEVKEAESWAGVLADLDPQLDARFTGDLDTWIFEGISALGGVASSRADGPLGWTSKPAVFTIGIRVILAAGYVLRSGGENDSVPRRKRCFEALKAFRDVGRESLVHELWLRQIDEALGGSV